jgi:hypothetical protein
MEKASEDDNEDEDEDEEADNKEGNSKDDSKDEHEEHGSESEDEQEEKHIADTLDVSDDEDEEERYRDQGFSRPRLLILCPMRKAALMVRDFARRELAAGVEIAFALILILTPWVSMIFCSAHRAAAGDVRAADCSFRA